MARFHSYFVSEKGKCGTSAVCHFSWLVSGENGFGKSAFLTQLLHLVGPWFGLVCSLLLCNPFLLLTFLFCLLVQDLGRFLEDEARFDLPKRVEFVLLYCMETWVKGHMELGAHESGLAIED